MSNTIITPNMNLILPTPGAEPGPQYGADQNQSFAILDGHNHAPGSGVPVTPAGMNIDSNLDMQNNGLLNLAFATFSVPASNASLATLYTNAQSGGGITDLFYNDGAGNVIALTKAGEVNATIASLPGESYAGGTFTWVQGDGSTTPANFDIGSITIRPNVAGTAFGVVLNPPVSISSQYDLQLPIIPGTASLLSLDTSGNFNTAMTSSLADSVGVAMSATGANAIGSAITSQAAGTNIGNLRVRLVQNGTATLGNIALSNSSGFAGTSSTSFVAVTNLSVTITTGGNPVQIIFKPDIGASVAGEISATSTTGQAEAQFQTLLGGSTVVSFTDLLSNATGAAPQINIPPGAMNFIDTSIAGTPGTYTYNLQFKLVQGSGVSCVSVVMLAYEL